MEATGHPSRFAAIQAWGIPERPHLRATDQPFLAAETVRGRLARDDVPAPPNDQAEGTLAGTQSAGTEWGGLVEELDRSYRHLSWDAGTRKGRVDPQKRSAMCSV